jgi:hypothetical protein
LRSRNVDLVGFRLGALVRVRSNLRVVHRERIRFDALVRV